MIKIAKTLNRIAQYGRAVGIGVALAGAAIAVLQGVSTAIPVAFGGVFCMFVSAVLALVARFLTALRT